MKSALHLSVGELGVALLAPAFGALIAMLCAGALVSAHGSRSTIRAAIVLFALPPVLIGTTRTLVEFFVVLLVWGAGIGSLDVSVNSQAVAVQQRSDRPLMSGFHARYSIGGLVGGGVGAAAAGLGISVLVQMTTLSTIALLIGEWATGPMLQDDSGGERRQQRFLVPDKQLLLLGTLGFAVLLCEGAATDWSAVYLRDVLGVSAGIAGLGYVAFSVGMILARLSGDRLTQRYGGGPLFRASSLAGAVGFSACLATSAPEFVILGFGLLGAGVACGAPLVFSAAGQHRHPGPSVATVTTGSYTGLLAGPPIIGAVAATAGLHEAMAIIPMVAVLWAVVASAGQLQAHAPSP
jgi:fucose permease